MSKEVDVMKGVLNRRKVGKDRVSDILVKLWGCTDQAGFDQMVIEAFCSCPIAKQKEFIRDLIDNGETVGWHEEVHPDDCEDNLLETAKKLVGWKN